MFRLIVIASLCVGLIGCGGAGDAPEKYRVTAASVEGGHVEVSDSIVYKGYTTTAYVVPDAHYKIASMKGCSGKLDGHWYQTGSILADCELTASFTLETYTVSVATTFGGTATPVTQEVPYNSVAKITFSPDEGYRVASVSGCNGVLTGKSFTTDLITAGCTVVPVFEIDPAATTSNALMITGLAAQGSALASTTIISKCADGSGFLSSVVTDTQGNFSGQVAASALPCALIAINTDSSVQYYSLVTEAGRVNITPLTSLTVALASQQAGADWLQNDDWQSTVEQLPLAQTLLKKALVDAGYNLPEEAFLPLTTEFKVGDDWDKVLDQLQQAIQSAKNIDNFDALVNLIKDGNLSSLPSAK